LHIVRAREVAFGGVEGIIARMVKWLPRVDTIELDDPSAAELSRLRARFPALSILARSAADRD
jgi:hypothetical protein